MQNATDRSTREIANSRLKLAADLVFTPQVHWGNICYHIESPARGVFFRVGYSEYVLLSLLDGHLTVSQALTVTARQLETESLTQAQGLEVAQWALENRLADFSEEDHGGCASSNASHEVLGLLQHFNPFSIRVPLGSPDRLLATLMPWLGWMCSPWATLITIAVILFGACSLALQWKEFAASGATVLSPSNWIWLGLAWLVLKIIHETAHGLACKYYRGEVREAGIVFVLFAPMAYVDVTSCWRLASKWQRMHVAAAGILVELFIAALAVLIWERTESILVRHLLYNVILMASLSTLLFNANPLMRFDGYYLLADFLEIPNLAAQGASFLHQLLARLFYGLPMRKAQLAGFRLACVICYGIASAVWRVLICFSLASAAAVLLHGAGLPLAVAGLVIWFGGPIWRVGCDLVQRFHEARTSFTRAICIGGALAVVATLIWTQVPWPGALTAPAIVEYSDLALIRARTSGFVERVHVRDGQQVAAGQLLLELRNDELLAELRELELAVEQGRVKHRVMLDKRDAAAAQVATRNLQALSERLEDVRRRAAGMSISAPIAGRIVGRNLPQRLGTYVREGSEILTIGDESRKELLLSVGQEELDALTPQVGKVEYFRIGSRWLQSGKLQRLEPRASLQLPHGAFASTAGGPLAVTANEGKQDQALRLTEPRFRGVIQLPPDVSQSLGAGERGYALLGMRRESVGQYCWVHFSAWLKTLLTPPTT